MCLSGGAHNFRACASLDLRVRITLERAPGRATQTALRALLCCVREYLRAAATHLVGDAETGGRVVKCLLRA